MQVNNLDDELTLMTLNPNDSMVNSIDKSSERIQDKVNIDVIVRIKVHMYSRGEGTCSLRFLASSVAHFYVFAFDLCIGPCHQLESSGTNH